MTLFVLQKACPPRCSGAIQHYTTKIANGVYATTANVNIVNYIQRLLIENKLQFSIVKDSKHGILPEIVVFK